MLHSKCSVKGKKSSKSKRGDSQDSVVYSRTHNLEITKLGGEMMILRNAIRDEKGNDKNILDGFSSFCKYQKNGQNLSIAFLSSKQFSKEKDISKFCFTLSKQNVQTIFNQSGYGWKDEEKKDDLSSKDSRFLIVRNANDQTLAGFVKLRFSLTGDAVGEMTGLPTLYVDEIQFISSVQRKGVGKYLLVLIELIARKLHLSFIFIPLVKGCTAMRSLLINKLHYEVNKSFSTDEEDPQELLSKKLEVKEEQKSATIMTMAKAIESTSTSTSSSASASSASSSSLSSLSSSSSSSSLSSSSSISTTTVSSVSASSSSSLSTSPSSSSSSSSSTTTLTATTKS
eukprot:TRINITY_DN1953_c0_g1_i1.p1 TRINITY_DN1953_c0_g1~~TRINITY_DN1953_c0_g1_i1.p1  ORF type:complete len:341 (-),score=145.74 TRINITY_DN1953_c0_g1_i1:1-1023(-)